MSTLPRFNCGVTPGGGAYNNVDDSMLMLATDSYLIDSVLPVFRYHDIRTDKLQLLRELHYSVPIPYISVIAQ